MVLNNILEAFLILLRDANKQLASKIMLNTGYTEKEDFFTLGIESSCDDTSIAILKNDVKLCNITATQKIHEQYGGVVPEMASRQHLSHILPLIHEALKQADVQLKDINAVAYTLGPGLIGSLLVGTSFAKGLSVALGLPLLEVNHMDGHILAHLIRETESQKIFNDFPFLCLTVSGGHTQISLVNEDLSIKVIGKTIDDAAGEAFDKVAKMLGLPYPGGPHIDKLAQKGNPNAYNFSTSKLPNFDFSFSGLKTSVLYTLKKKQAENPNIVSEDIENICASLQHTITNYLMEQMQKAILEYNVKAIALAGGVAANSSIRNSFLALGKQNNINAYIPPFEYCTDNAAMIAIVGYYKRKKSTFNSLRSIPFAKSK